MVNLVIRPLEQEDVDAVVELLHQLTDYAHSVPEPDSAHVRKLHSAMLESPLTYKNLVACKEGAVLGFISVVYYASFLHKGGTALINELVVSANCRNAGIGKALVQRAALTAQEDGMDEIEVGTERDNESAIAFYRKAGFGAEYVLFGRNLNLLGKMGP
jgi:ribosomal protein S18 acetylase RimI-like enzyme